MRLRQLIADNLPDDRVNLPTHMHQRVEKHLLQTAKKNPALDLESYEVLTHQLEFADLRELQDIIVTNALWGLMLVG